MSVRNLKQLSRQKHSELERRTKFQKEIADLFHEICVNGRVGPKELTSILPYAAGVARNDVLGLIEELQNGKISQNNSSLDQHAFIRLIFARFYRDASSESLLKKNVPLSHVILSVKRRTHLEKFAEFYKSRGVTVSGLIPKHKNKSLSSTQFIKTDNSSHQPSSETKKVESNFNCQGISRRAALVSKFRGFNAVSDYTIYAFTYNTDTRKTNVEIGVKQEKRIFVNSSNYRVYATCEEGGVYSFCCSSVLSELRKKVLSANETKLKPTDEEYVNQFISYNIDIPEQREIDTTAIEVLRKNMLDFFLGIRVTCLYYSCGRLFAVYSGKLYVWGIETDAFLGKEHSSHLADTFKDSNKSVYLSKRHFSEACQIYEESTSKNIEIVKRQSVTSKDLSQLLIREDELKRWVSLKKGPERLLNPLPRIKQVAAGKEHVVALCRDGEVYVWGSGTLGRLGLGLENTQARTSPVRLANLDERISSVACGSAHVIALSDSGCIYSWGYGIYGQLGHGISEDSYTFVDVACGDDHTLILSTKGNVFSFGKFWHGQLGLGKVDNNILHPTKISEFGEECCSSAYLICATSCISAAVTLGGDIFVWGKCGPCSHNDYRGIVDRYSPQRYHKQDFVDSNNSWLNSSYYIADIAVAIGCVAISVSTNCNTDFEI